VAATALLPATWALHARPAAPGRLGKKELTFSGLGLTVALGRRAAAASLKKAAEILTLLLSVQP
jgi:hypothetical protein